jgi:L-arabinose 1-dehydrogenase [NAD(P)+]
MSPNVAVTGAAGNVGREALAALDDHDLTAITHREHDDLESEVLEITDDDAVRTAFEGQDAVVHLAANPSPSADWDAVHEVNIDGTHTVYEAAREAGVERVVFASTNHVTQMYNAADPERPESMVEDPEPVHPDQPPRPDSFYAVSKVCGEALGSYYADRHGMEAVDLRIGWLLTREELRERQTEDDALAGYARAMWLSPRDCRAAVRRAVEADLPEDHVTVNAVSRNGERYLSLVETNCTLGYRPEDDSDAVIGG